MFYQVISTRTSLGGSPCSDRNYFKVWDNAHAHVQHLREYYEKMGFHVTGEDMSHPYRLSLMNSKTGTAVDIEVYTCEFAD